MVRHTFVVQVHPDGISTLENLNTRERVRISEFASVGRQIERWLAEASDQDGATPSSAPAAPGSSPGSVS
jgi:hypothetical protein